MAGAFANAGSLQAESLKLAFPLAVVGYGTKVGLAPMHSWLPDAHAEAPSPASAMLSAALLNTGMYAIMRFQALTGAQLGHYANNALLAFGFASIAIGAIFMIRRRNFKRLFAYSSVEHMGIIAVGLGFGSIVGIYGALLHTLNHAIGKCVLFLASGEVVIRYRTTNADELGGIVGSAPVVGGVMLLGSLRSSARRPSGSSSPNSRSYGPASRNRHGSRSCCSASSSPPLSGSHTPPRRWCSARSAAGRKPFRRRCGWSAVLRLCSGCSLCWCSGSGSRAASMI